MHHGQTWWEQVDSVLNIEVYLQEYLHADARVDSAAKNSSSPMPLPGESFGIARA